MKINILKSVKLSVLALFIAAGLLAGCSSNKSTNSDNTGGNNNPPPANLVRISNFAFSPQSLTVAVGDTVTWTNNDSVNHTVTSNSGNMMHSSMMGHNQSYRVVFTTVGAFPYHCTVHPNMTATIIVQ